MVEWKVEIPGNTISREWYNYIWVEEPILDKNKWMKGKTINQVAQAQNKGIIDAFLDLVVEEKLETTFVQAENNVDVDAMKAILNFPNALIGLSDGGAHVQFNGGYGFSTRLLGEWVREKGIMGLEQAVRRLTLDSASTFGLYDRWLLRPGMAADITIFDPDTVKPLPEFIVHDLPAGGRRFKEPAAGIYATFVNGKMLMKEGEHTGNLPGRVLRNSRYQANHG
jgi:N-acyl-D-amino-acid deacylase